MSGNGAANEPAAEKERASASHTQEDNPKNSVIVSKYPPRIRVDRSKLLVRSPKATVGRGNETLGKTLVVAVRGKKTGVVEQLLDRGVDPNSRGPPDNKTALWGATRMQDISTMTLLLDFGADPDLETPIVHTAHVNAPRRCQLLLERGANPNEYLVRFTALNWACDGNKAEVIELLMMYGAYPNSRNRDRETNLFYATRGGSPSVVQNILAFGADINLVSTQSRTALTESLYHRRQDIVLMLLNNGANPNLKATPFPLATACKQNCSEVVKVLVVVDVYVLGEMK